MADSLFNKEVLIKRNGSGIIEKLEAALDIKNFVNRLHCVDKAERLLAGGCKECFQINAHIKGCTIGAPWTTANNTNYTTYYDGIDVSEAK